MSSPRRVRVGVLGAGAWARAAHLPGFARDPRCEIVAIADPDKALAAAAAAEFGIPFVDMWHDLEIRRPGYWVADRIHLNPTGHRRVAGRVLTALGHPPTTRPGQVADPRRSLSEHLVFYREHVGPWVRRRIQGRSSGDHRSAKHPAYVTVSPAMLGQGG